MALILALVGLAIPVWKGRFSEGAKRATFFLLILFAAQVLRVVTIPKADDFYWSRLRDELSEHVSDWRATVQSSQTDSIDIPVPETLKSLGINEILGGRSPRGEEVVQVFTGIGLPMGHSGFLVALNGPLPLDSEWRSVWNLRPLGSNWYRLSH
jgi:hypothetical protein